MQKQVFNLHDVHDYFVVYSSTYLLIIIAFIKELANVSPIIDCSDNRLISNFEETLCLNTHQKESRQLVHSVKANSTFIIEPQELFLNAVILSAKNASQINSPQKRIVKYSYAPNAIAK